MEYAASTAKGTLGVSSHLAPSVPSPVAARPVHISALPAISSAHLNTPFDRRSAPGISRPSPIHASTTSDRTIASLSRDAVALDTRRPARAHAEMCSLVKTKPNTEENQL